VKKHTLISNLVIALMALGWIGCSTGPVVMANHAKRLRPTARWHPRAISPLSYQGIGDGNDCATARDIARLDLCKSFYVVVEGKTDIRKQEALRQRLENGRKTESLKYSQVVTMVTRTRTRCVFNGRPFREYRHVDENGQCHVQLVMSTDQYIAYLRQHTVKVVLIRAESLDGPAFQPIITAIENILSGRGYVVVLDKTAKTANFARARFDITVNGPNPQGLYAMDIRLDLKIINTADAALKFDLSYDSGLVYGWSKTAAGETAINQLTKKMSLEQTGDRR